MRSRKPSRHELLRSCSDLGPEDGLDPRIVPRDLSRKVPNRKALQLCGQVARTLSGLLAGECTDDLLRDLDVESVVPAPNSARLLVTLAWTAPAGAVRPSDVLAHLQRASGWLRAEVAAAIHRKRVPELLFQLHTPHQER